MALFPLAGWIGPTPNRVAGGMTRPILGLVLHIQQGSEAGSESWLKNPAAQASAHFLNPKVGNLRQLVDTNDRAWAEAGGNDRWVSVENEGMAGDSLTASQIVNAGDLLAWLHISEGVPLALTDNPAIGGLGYHAMGGASWGGHLSCPGASIIEQRAEILAHATQTLGGDTMSAADVTAINTAVGSKIDSAIAAAVATIKAELDPMYVRVHELWDAASADGGTTAPQKASLVTKAVPPPAVPVTVDAAAVAASLATLLGPVVTKQVADELARRLSA